MSWSISCSVPLIKDFEACDTEYQSSELAHAPHRANLNTSSWRLALSRNQHKQASTLSLDESTRYSKIPLAAPQSVLRASIAAQVFDTKRRLSLPNAQVLLESRRSRLRRYTASDIFKARNQSPKELVDKNYRPRPKFIEQRLSDSFKATALHDLHRMAELLSHTRGERRGSTNAQKHTGQEALLRTFASKYLQSIGVFPTSTKIDKVCQQYTLTKFQRQFSSRGQDGLKLGNCHHLEGAARIRRELDDGIAEIECRNRIRHSNTFKDEDSGVDIDPASRREEAVIANSVEMQTCSAQNLGPQWRTISVDEATQALLHSRHNLVELPRTSSKRVQMVRRELDSQAMACIVVLLVHLSRVRLMRKFGFLENNEQMILEISKTYFLASADLRWAKRQRARNRFWMRLLLFPSFIRCLVEAMKNLFAVRNVSGKQIDDEIDASISDWNECDHGRTDSEGISFQSKGTLSLECTCMFFLASLKDKVRRFADRESPPEHES